MLLRQLPACCSTASCLLIHLLLLGARHTNTHQQEAEAGWADLAPEMGELACELGEVLWQQLLDDTAVLLTGLG